jgi:hypothetical protein
MISSDELKNYIAEIGYRTHSEIKQKFADENPEVLSLNLSYLISKNHIKQIKFLKSKVYEEDLYYIAY